MRGILYLLLIFTTFFLQKAFAELSPNSGITSALAVPGVPTASATLGLSKAVSKSYHLWSWPKPKDISEGTYFTISNNDFPIVNPSCINVFIPGFKDDSYIRVIDLSMCQYVESYRHIRISRFAFPPRKLIPSIGYDYNNENGKDGSFSYNFIG